MKIKKDEYTNYPCDGCGAKEAITKLCVVGHAQAGAAVRKMICRTCRKPENMKTVRDVIRIREGLL